MTGSRQPAANLLADDFRQLMAGFPAGVAVVTAFDLAGRPWGMTCSSLCSVTLSPPTLLVCLRHNSPTRAAVCSRAAFTVNLLHDQAQATAELFASGNPHRFDLVSWCPPEGTGGPHLAGAIHAIADCRVSRLSEVGDHTVIFGEVVRISSRGKPNPLLYGLRRYAGWSRIAMAPGC